MTLESETSTPRSLELLALALDEPLEHGVIARADGAGWTDRPVRGAVDVWPRIPMHLPVEAKKASMTARGVALLRVLHQHVDGEPRILYDPVSEMLLDPAAIRWAMDHLDRFQTPEARGLRAHVVVRSRYSEDALAEAVARGVGQLVVLDTFAYRQPAWARALRIFEVDHPASQEEKWQRLAAAGVPLPGNLVGVSVDFERESLGSRLQRAGLDRSQPTFFSCLGVLMYLEDAAIDELLGFLGGRAEGSEVVLTFSPETERSAAHREMVQHLAAVGEPLRSTISEQALSVRLQRAGFRVVTFASPEEIGNRYLRDRTDGLRPPRYATLARARI